MRRVVTPERMDDPNVDADDLHASLRFIRRVNASLGGSAALIRHLDRWSRAWPTDRPVTLLDLATGSADLPVAVRGWAASRGYDLRVTGIDCHARTLDAARAHVAAQPAHIRDGIILEAGDALEAADRFGSGSFDYAHAGLFLHHLPKMLTVMTALRVMERVAQRGIVWNDLTRSRLSLAVTHALCVGQPAIVRHDATVSVRAGFTRAEVLEFRDRLDIGWAAYRRHLFAGRFTLAGEVPDAWA